MKLMIRVLSLVLLTAAVAMATGCSLVGKRRNAKTWQVSLLNARSFGEGKQAEGKYIFALYDGALPTEDNLALIQLWSGPRKSSLEMFD